MGYSLANDACHRNSHEQQHEEENMTRDTQGNDQGAHKNDKRGEGKGWFPGLDHLLSPTYSIALGYLCAHGST